MILPPEILSKILKQIPASNDSEKRQTLIACALVATWWTGPSQRRLFSVVDINCYNYSRWIDGVVLSRSKDHLLAYVRWLLDYPCDGQSNYWMKDLAHKSGGYISGLRNLRELTLAGISTEHIGERELDTCFSIP